MSGRARCCCVTTPTTSGPGARATPRGCSRPARERRAQVACSPTCDPEAVAACIEAGVGSDVTVSLGGKRDPRHGEPLEVSGRVRLISDGAYRNSGKLWTGNGGSSAVTVLVAGGIEIVISERPDGGADPAVLTSNGIDPQTKSVIVIKSQIFGPKSYGEAVSDHVVVDGEGWATSDFHPPPLHQAAPADLPLDDDVTFEPPRRSAGFGAAST